MDREPRFHPLRDQCAHYLAAGRTGMVLSTDQVQDLLKEIARLQAHIEEHHKVARKARCALVDHDLEGVRNHLAMIMARQIEGAQTP